MKNKTIERIGRLFHAMELLNLQEDEVWREIDFIPETDLDGKYFVSNYGRIISLCRKEPIELKQFVCGNGYFYVSIGKRDYRVNRLVALAFIPNPDNKRIVHHKDANRKNNHCSNLEWATDQENIRASYKKQKDKEKKDA